MGTHAVWLAHLMRPKLLPLGYIYPKEKRALSDLLRRRVTGIVRLVQKAKTVEEIADLLAF
jgi:hypothetical protein